MGALKFYKGESMNIIFTAYDNGNPPKLMDISSYTKSVELFTPYSLKLTPTVSNINNNSFQINLTADQTKSLEAGNFNIVVRLSKGTEVKIGKSIPCSLLDPYMGCGGKGLYVDEGQVKVDMSIDASAISFDMFFGTANIMIDGADAEGYIAEATKNKADKVNENGELVVYAPDGLIDISPKTDKSTILNVSQLNNKYDYIDNTAARNAIQTNLRGKGQIISYRLITGKWVTERFDSDDLSLWADETKWISTLKFITSINGIDYISPPEAFEFKNLVPSYSNVNDYFLDANGVEQKARFTDQISYNQIYVPVQPNVTYMCNSVKAQDDQRFIFYDSSMTVIGSSFGTRTTKWGGIFTTPANCAFVRYNYIPGIGNNSQIYIYPTPESNVIKKLAVDLGVEDMRGAFEVEVESNSGNILPATLNMGKGYLNGWNAVSSGDFLYTIDYLPIEGGVEYTTNLVNLDPMFLFYDSEKRFITNNGVASNSSPFGDFTTPINAAYIRFNGRTSIFDGFYIKKKNAGKNIVIPNLYIPASNVIDDANPVEKLDYYACGDSLTEGANSWAVKMAAKLGLPLTNLAIGGKMAMGDDGLILQINQIPADFKGLVTVMIGTNDCWQRRTVGDANTTLSKSFGSLTLTDNFSDAYRKCMETLVRKAPESRIVCMTPAPTNLANIEQYREVERIICKWLSIPIYDVYNEIGIFSGNLNIYAPIDGVHVTEAAHIKIARVFGNKVKALL